MRFMVAPQFGLAPRSLIGQLSLIDDVWRDEDQQVATGLRAGGVTEQPSDERKIDQHGKPGLGELHAGLCEAADHDGLTVWDAKLRAAAVVVDQHTVRTEGGA